MGLLNNLIKRGDKQIDNVDEISEETLDNLTNNKGDDDDE